MQMQSASRRFHRAAIAAGFRPATRRQYVKALGNGDVAYLVLQGESVIEAGVSHRDGTVSDFLQVG